MDGNKIVAGQALLLFFSVCPAGMRAVRRRVQLLPDLSSMPAFTESGAVQEMHCP